MVKAGQRQMVNGSMVKTTWFVQWDLLVMEETKKKSTTKMKIGCALKQKGQAKFGWAIANES